MVLLLFLCLLSGCGNTNGEEIDSFADFSRKGVRIGVEFDLPEHDQLKQEYPDAAVVAYSDYHLGYEDVSNGRLDAYVYSRIELEFAIENGVKGVRILDDSYCVHEIAVGLSPASRIPDLQKKINAFLAELTEDGTLDDMYSRWVVRREGTMPEIPKAENPSGTLRVGTTGTLVPFTYYVGDKLNGYDIELGYRFAAWLNMDIEFRVYDFSGIVSAATSGDIDCIMSNLFKTDEIAETIPFSDTLFTDDITAMVRDTGEKTIRSLDDLKQGRVAVLTGSNFAEHVLRSLPDAELLYFNTLADSVNAVKNGKADAAAMDEPSARYIMAQDDEVAILPDVLEKLDYGFIFPKDSGESLRNRFNEFLAKARESGLLKELETKWFDASDVSLIELPDYRELPAVNGVLDLATIQNPPFSFVRNNLMGGYDIELFYLFCRENGYALDVTDVPMDAVLSSVQSGKYNAACCGISITEERQESMLFSDPNYTGGTVLLVSRGGAGGSGEGFFQSIGSSFYKTFIREDRWIMFLEGIGTTLLITVLSVLAGTLLGFFVFMGCRKGNRFANAVTRFCIWLIHGMPVVVLLMVLYYIVFGKVDISGTIVSVFAFTLIFGSAVFSMLKAGVGAVDRGQTEAALALGFTDRKLFYRVVLPQAMPHFMPSYKSEITSLIKATAVVGYVTVQDLTKVGDIVRSRTYEAFFPLIAVAVIYFLLAALLTLIVNRIEIRIDPRRRTPDRILKGVSRDD